MIWLYAFSTAMRSGTSRRHRAEEDAFLFGLSDMDSNRLGELLRKKRHSLIGWVLVAVGVYALRHADGAAERSLLRLVRGDGSTDCCAMACPAWSSLCW